LSTVIQLQGLPVSCIFMSFAIKTVY